MVLLAAGMDARAFRLPWPEGTVLYEVDRDDVIQLVRQAEPVARLPRGDHRAGGAAGTLTVGPGGIHPEPQRHTQRAWSGAQERNGAVDAAAHRDGDPVGVRVRPEDRPERVGERVDRERLAADGRGLEQRQAGERTVETGRVRLDDPVVLDRQTNERELRASRGVTENFDHRVRLAALLCDGSTLFVARAST